MVYLVLTPQGLREILAITEEATVHIWCSADAISEEAFEQLARGNVTRFSHSFANKVTLKQALSTIEEHHPSDVI